MTALAGIWRGFFFAGNFPLDTGHPLPRFILILGTLRRFIVVHSKRVSREMFGPEFRVTVSCLADSYVTHTRVVVVL